MTSNDLLIYIDKLKKMYNSSKTNEEKAYYRFYIRSLIKTYNNIEHKNLKFKTPLSIYKIQQSTKEFYFNEFRKNVATKQYRNMIEEICSNSLNILDNKEYLDINYSFNYQELKELIISFFNDFDKELGNFVKYCLEEKTFIVDAINRNGFLDDKYIIPYCSYIEPFKESYIVIDKNRKNILGGTAHELGHMINLYYSTQRENFNYLKYLHDCFAETPSTIFEMFFMNWCIENNIHKDEMIKMFKNRLYDLIQLLQDLKIINVFIDKTQKNFINIKPKDYSIAKSKNLHIYESLICHIDEKYQYSYGLLLALYYLNSYKENKEQTKINIIEFIKNIGLHNDMYMLNNFGIDIKEFIKCDYLEKQKNLTKGTI